ncbi:MAG: LysM peptidoglycan-binding domain-containing protein [Chitinophagaceae bacterium]
MKKQLLLALLISFCFLSSFSQELMVRNNGTGPYLDHRVVAKEGMYSIGRLYNVNPKTIAAYNKIDLYSGLEIGQILHIPLNDTNFTQKSSKGTPVYYLPAAGEGLMKVSNANNKVTLANLRSWNKLPDNNIRAGEKLVVGFLVSKDYKPTSPSPEQNIDEPQGTQVVKTEPVRTEPVRTEKPASNPIVPKTEPTKEVVQEVITRAPEKPVIEPTNSNAGQVKTGNESGNSGNGQVKTGNESGNSNNGQVKISSEDGFFKSFFEQQVRVSPITKNTTVTSGIFKTSSGWQDSKYYLLMDGVATGTIIRLINPDNNKAVYAKVLGEMNGIRQNQGLGIRISNAAASALGIREEDKFIVRVNY